jgi:hypothetical protein
MMVDLMRIGELEGNTVQFYIRSPKPFINRLKRAKMIEIQEDPQTLLVR